MDKQPWLKRKQAELDELHGLCNSIEELELVVELLERFTYLRGDDFEVAAAAIVNTVHVEWKLIPATTLIIPKGSKSDSSQAVTYLMQAPFEALNAGWSKQNFTTSLTSAILSPTARSLILIDDFSGSGNSLNKLANWIEAKAKELRVPSKPVYACFFCAMEQTMAQTYPTNLKEIYASKWIKKGISEFYAASDIAPKIETMKRIESRLHKLPSQYSLGYEASEALYACHSFNIPNNNFPIFWYKRGPSGRTLKPLFQRMMR